MGTNADLVSCRYWWLNLQGASALTSTGALTGVLKGNGSSAPSAMTSTANYVTYWSGCKSVNG